MKKQSLLNSIFLLLFLGSATNAQFIEFTRLDTGALVKDLGNSQGSALADIDNDGDIDLLIGNTSGFGPSRPVLLYKNERGGHFTRIKTGDLATQKQPAVMPTATFADIDNDGDWDACTPCIFYMNDGYGGFTKEYMDPETEEGCGDAMTTWVDINQDGFLDFYIWTQSYKKNLLYENNGDGTFTQNKNDVLAITNTSTESLSWADIDNDGDMDVFVCNFSFPVQGWINSTNRNTCFINEEGMFTKLEKRHLLLKDSLGSAGASWGDYDNDGDLDLYVATLRGCNHLYRNEGDLIFTQLTIDPSPANDLSIPGKGFLGSDWGDFDNDGDLDLFVTSEMHFLRGALVTFTYFNMLFRNNGDGSFTELASGNLKTDGGHSCSLLDHDNDGDLDILIPNGSLGDPMTNYIYSNNGNSNNWINISCKGTVSNTSAIGTRIRLKATINGNEVWQLRELAQQTGLHSVSSPRFHFGLGNAEIIDSMIIRWPSGLTDTYVNVQPNSFYRAVEDEVMELDLTATNYIEYVPPIHAQLMGLGESTTIDLADHYRFVTGDSVPEINGDIISFTLFEDENPDELTSSLNGSKLTIQAGNLDVASSIKIKVSAGDFVERIDYISVLMGTAAGIHTLKNDKSVTLYPNPTSDQLTLEFSQNQEGPITIELMDISGKVVYTSSLENNTSTYAIDLHSFKEGLYLIRITNNEYSYTEKVIKVE